MIISFLVDDFKHLNQVIQKNIIQKDKYVKLHAKDIDVV